MVSCALWGRVVYNTGDRKCWIGFRAFHNVSLSQPPIGQVCRTGAGLAVVSTDLPDPASVLTAPLS